VTEMPDLPSVTRSAAVRGAACKGSVPTLLNAPTASDVLINSRRERVLMGASLIGMDGLGRRALGQSLRRWYHENRRGRNAPSSARGWRFMGSVCEIDCGGVGQPVYAATGRLDNWGG